MILVYVSWINCRRLFEERINYDRAKISPGRKECRCHSKSWRDALPCLFCQGYQGPQGFPGVKEAEVSLEARQAKVTYIAGATTPELLEQAIIEAGYTFEGFLMTAQTDPEGTTTSPEEAIIHVGGMHCAACVARVEKTLQAVPGVQEAVVNLATREAQLKFDPAQTDNSQFAQVLEEAGYTHEGMVDLETPGAAFRVDPEVLAFKNRFLVALILNIPIFFCPWCIPCPIGWVCRRRLSSYLLLALTTPVMFYPGRRFLVGPGRLSDTTLPI